MPQPLTILLIILAAITAAVLIKNFYMAKELWSFMKVRKKHPVKPVYLYVYLDVFQKLYKPAPA
ncbi:hypothetical protein HYU15_00505 [Candidatus Woesearchaeota archaeon]|nr:hypothetical protein [Candidatus Woesearchaeota archaeon]